ncbi:MAG: tRNA pseudouridine(38-40) synthase TruA [Firmicutes bacterium]|nr:tRNA pseudouridine(38-40) synthase TruA [Bacillota bacterium]
MMLAIKISYDGTNYCGWQSQKNGLSIQERIEEAIFNLIGERIQTIASGRTDAGVHALGQVVSFKVTKDFDINKIVKGLNFYLPEDIKVIEVFLENDDFNARFSAVKKTYSYMIYEAKIDSPLLKNRALRVDNVDIKSLIQVKKQFIGEHDFVRYNSSGGGAKTTTRKIYDLEIFEDEYFGQRIIKIEITANGFLYNMVRKIVGVLLKRDKDFIKSTLKEPFETVKEIVPPYGLYLKEVFYAKNN